MLLVAIRLIKVFKVVICVTTVAISSFSTAANKTELIINLVMTTYGGEKFRKIKTIQLTDQFKTFRDGQSYSPQEIDIEHNYADVFIDVEKMRKNFRWIIGDKDDYSIRHWLFDGKDGYAISHASQTQSINDMVSYDFADRYHSHLLDTVIIQALITNRADATWLGEVNFFGQRHDRLRFRFSDNIEAELYINQKSGYLTYMEKTSDNAKRTLRYHYKGHKKQQGIAFAKDVHVTRGGNPNIVVTDRQVKFNKPIGNGFDLPKDYGASPASMDMSVMTIEEVMTGVYLVGQNWGYSVFVDVGDHFIAAGGYSELTERFNALKSFAKVDKPLQKMVVSHHHNDHIGGLAEAIKLGATLIAVEQHVNSVKGVVETPLNDAHFSLVENKASFANGQVVVFDMPSGHTSHNLMTYIPAAKLLFSADTYFSRQQNGAPFGGAHLQKINDRLTSLQLPVEKFAAAHSARILTAEDFLTSITKTIESVCPTSWQICQVMETQ
jgi:glyoxylase-like metal-dependent hydrolase (beta-lactamase superfamily II)